MNAAYLWAQIEGVDTIQDNRMAAFDYYDKGLRTLADGAYWTAVYPCRMWA